MTISYYLWDTTTHSKTEGFFLEGYLPVRYDTARRDTLAIASKIDMDLGWSYLYGDAAEPGAYFGWTWYSPPPPEQLKVVSIEELLGMELPGALRSFLLRDL